VPLIREWASFKQPPSLRQVEEWAQEHPMANLGVLHGAPSSGLVSVDVDGPAGEELLLALSEGHVPQTCQFRTGSGRRLLFRWPGRG
jgi:hypothetical protein